MQKYKFMVINIEFKNKKSCLKDFAFHQNFLYTNSYIINSLPIQLEFSVSANDNGIFSHFTFIPI